jgi:hypothetical protein
MSPPGSSAWNEVMTSEMSGVRKNSTMYRMPGSSRTSAIVDFLRGGFVTA